MPFVLGQALSRNALHGGNATNDNIEAQNIALLLRGGRLPQASVSPAARRATRALLQRRMPCMRTRAEVLTPVQHPNRQDHLPAIGQKMADQANRGGVAERGPAPAVQKSLAVDRALLGPADDLRRDMACSLLRTAKPHNAHTRDL